MAENELIVTAGLDFKASEGLIISQLNKIQDEYNNNGGMQINCKISDESLKAIQNSLGNLTQTLNVDVNAQNIQQNISRAIKNQKVEVDITTKINKREISNEAKELEKILYMDFDFNRTKAEAASLRKEFTNIIAEYDKAFKSNNFNEAANQLQKLSSFCEEYYQGLDNITREIYKQEQAMKSLSSKSMIYINPSQYEEIKGAYGQNAKSFVDNLLGIGNWSTKKEGTTRDWADFAGEINQIINKDLYKVAGDYYDTVARLNTVHPLEGLEQFANLLEQSAMLAKANLGVIDEELQKNQQVVVNWYDTLYNLLGQKRGLDTSASLTDGFVDILSDETVKHTEQNAQKMAQAYSTVQAAKDLYKDDKSVKSVTSDWVFDANKNITGFTININKLNGEVERLNHTITETGEVKFLGGSGSDKGVEKQAETMIKFVNEYTAKLNSLKAKVGEQFAPNITATLGDDMQKTTVTFDSFEKKLAELLKGNGNIGELRSEFTALDGVVKSLGAQLRGSDTSLNQFTNAINNARKFDNDLKALEVDYNNLNEKQRESETLTKSLADAQKKLANLRNTQQTEGYTEKWIDQYHQVSIALTQLTADLKLAKKLEREDTSSAAHKQAAALREVKDAYDEILSLSRKLYQPNATGEYRAELERKIAGYDAIIKKLEGEKEFNEEFRKEVAIYKEAYQDELRLMQLKNSEAETQKAKNEEIARQKALQQELTRIETEALREQSRQQQELDSQRKKDLDEISGIYTKIISLYGKINSTTISEADKKDAERRLSLYNDMVVAVVERAKAEGTYNQEFRRQIDEHEKIYQREYDLIQLHRGDAEAVKAANEQVRQQAVALAELRDAYREITSLSNKISSPSTKSEYKAELERQLAVQNDIVNKTILRAQEEGLINKEFREQIQLYERIQQDSLLAAQAKQRDADITREETEATKQLAEQTKYVKNALKELDSLKTASSYKNTGGVNANIIRDSLTSLGLSTKSSDIGSLKNLFNQMLGKIDKATTISDIQAIEKELGNLKSMFDETVKSTNAETEAAKQMSDALSKIDSAIGKMQNINKQLITGNLTQGEIESKKKEFQNQNLILLQEKERLATAGLLTQQIDKRIKQLGDESNEISRQLGKDKQRAEAKKEAEAIAKKEEEDARKILAIYKEIAAQNKILANPNSTDTQIRQATEKVDRERQALALMYDELGVQTMLNGKRAEAMAQGERLAADAVNIAREQQQAAQAKKDETEAEKAYKKELQDVNKILKDNIAALEKFNNSSATNKNSANTKVQSQIVTNNNLIAQLQGFSQSLKDDSSVSNVQRIKQEIDKLVPSLEQATKDSEALNRELRDTGANNTANANLEKLKNQMVSFSNANLKAVNSTKMMRDGVTTFAQGWQNLLERLNSGKLDAAGIQKLTQDFQVFKGEVNAAGLSVTRVFTNMGSQLRMLTQRYISLYAVINYIKKMVSAVKELDTAMINVRRVTDETAEGYEQFLVKANKMAQELNTTTSTLVESAYQFAKMSYDLNQSLDLAKSATIFAKVADIEESTAVTELIATMKAFNIEAEKAIDIVDKLDNLNNKFAVSASGLGEGLERSASALAMTGNTLEQTLAMLTGAGEITQQLDNTGNALKILSLRLQNMKGALQELDEPVDDLMEVSKVQTQILNLTHNQVDIFDSATQEFRSTYDIMKDISEIWDSLSSTNRANLTEILFGKNRANYGLALIQAFQTGEVQRAYKEATDAAGTATEEYKKMMEGIQSQTDALKGSFEEFANAFIKSDFIKGAISFLKALVNGLTLLTKKVGSLGVALAPLAVYISAKTKMNVFSAIIAGIRGITASTTSLAGAATGASVAVAGLETVLTSIMSLGMTLVIGAVISLLGKLVDKLIVTKKEAAETVTTITDNLVSLGDAIDELESNEAKLKSIAETYSKIATTVVDVTERKQQLNEVQTDLVDSFGKEAEGIDLVNGKYSEQIKKLDEIAKKQQEQLQTENAVEINQAKRLSKLNVGAPDEIKYSDGTIIYDRKDDRRGDLAYWTLEDLDGKAIEVGKNIEGVYRTLQGTFDAQGLYLTGTVEEARDQLGKIIDAYSKLSEIDEETYKYLQERYTVFNTAIENMDKYGEYWKDESSSAVGQMIENVYDSLGDTVVDAAFQPFYDKLDEAQEKLQKLATEDLGIDEFAALTTETKSLKEELYKMAGGSEWAQEKVTDLFEAYQQGISENGDGLQEFLERFESQLEGSFKDTAEIITSVQNGIEKLSEGKGLTNSEAWKLLKADSEGYLQTIKLVNGEYIFAEEELIKFKDAEIQKTIETIKADNVKAQAAVNNLKAQNAEREQTLYLMRQEIETNAILMGQQEAAKKYAEDSKKLRIQVSETKTTIEDYEKAIARNNLLVEELAQNLGNANTAADAVLQSLNDTVDALEAEVDAIEDAVDALNARKDALESEKDILQDQLDLLKEQEKELKNQMDTFKKAVSDYSKRYEETLKTELDHIKEQKDEIKDQYDERINALKRENEERDTAYKKEKAILDLNKAKEQQVRTYSSARGWEYGADKEKVLEAQKNLDDVLLDEQIQNLENERDDIIKTYEDQEKEQDKRLKSFQEYAKKYEEAAEVIENADAEMLAEQILGANWRVEMENQDEGLLDNYKNAYQDFTNRLDDLTNRQIKAAEESVKAKQAEIDKIDDEIKAYNNYKNTVKSNLDEAKKAVENYKNEVTGYSQAVIDSTNDMEKKVVPAIGAIQGAFGGLETSIWENSGKICGWIADVIGAFNELQDKVGSGAVGAFGMGLSILGSHAKGGVADYTGLAMLHGSKSSPETIFNATDSKKLYDMIHNTPNVMASMIKQATQIAGFNPSNVSNNTANSINVNIGQVVANNPQELTRNLDTHLDSYFRRKLTQGYTQ